MPQWLRGSIFLISGQPQTDEGQFLRINPNAIMMLGSESLACKVSEMLHFLVPSLIPPKFWGMTWWYPHFAPTCAWGVPHLD